MNNWHQQSLVEDERRKDKIKAAEKYRLVKLVGDDPSEPPAPKVQRHFFSSLGAMLVRWGKRLQKRQPAPRQDYILDR